jgi:hypothetical protein
MQIKIFGHAAKNTKDGQVFIAKKLIIEGREVIVLVSQD